MIEDDGIEFRCQGIEAPIEYVLARVLDYTRGVEWQWPWHNGGRLVVDRQSGPRDYVGFSAEDRRVVSFRGFVHAAADAEGVVTVSGPVAPASVVLTPLDERRTDLEVRGAYGAGRALWPVVERLAGDYPEVAASLVICRNAAEVELESDRVVVNAPAVRIRDWLLEHTAGDEPMSAKSAVFWRGPVEGQLSFQLGPGSVSPVERGIRVDLLSIMLQDLGNGRSRAHDDGIGISFRILELGAERAEVSVTLGRRRVVSYLTALLRDMSKAFPEVAQLVDHASLPDGPAHEATPAADATKTAKRVGRSFRGEYATEAVRSEWLARYYSLSSNYVALQEKCAGCIERVPARETLRRFERSFTSEELAEIERRRPRWQDST